MVFRIRQRVEELLDWIIETPESKVEQELYLFIYNICLLSTFVFLRIKLFFLLCCVDSFYFHSEITYIVIPHETFCVIIRHNNNSNFLQVESRISSSFQFSFKSKVLFLLPPIRLSSFLPQQINKDLKRRKRKKIWVSKKKYIQCFSIHDPRIFCDRASTHNWTNKRSNEACSSRSRRLIGKQLHGSTVWSASHCSWRSVARSQEKKGIQVIRSF